ncbi:hypothetical protein F0U44_12080 [Nocardioides humilatus]|uniref:Uncharacterized protein n=1 Tax=Nocardioides humilatus TaxID=2607660 RepID=A0A5B1LEQ0_9ACTN|nr:hypothetical protein [Nocardioides humilatus]KAA1419183.1 hypothetical protein F0U44_12080 [Nocardioides humilatus]
MTDREVWAEAAYKILGGVAGNYHAVVEYSQLGDEIQALSGVTTTRPVRSWIGSTLELVADRCVTEGIPPLTALVVRKDTGMVGETYDVVLTAIGADLIPDVMQREKHAAQSRLQCYQWANAEGLPPDGGRAALAPRLAASTARHAKLNPAPAKVCPKCNMALLPTGVCDSCY